MSTCSTYANFAKSVSRVYSRRWREAQQRFNADLRRIEGDERFDGVQKFLGAVHRLTSERRLSRIAYVVENRGA